MNPQGGNVALGSTSATYRLKVSSTGPNNVHYHTDHANGGYNVYQLPLATSPLSEGVKVATYDKVNAIQNILDAAIDPVTSLELQVAKQTGSNSGVQRYFHSDYDEIRGRPMSNGVTYHFAVTAYSYLDNLSLIHI